MMDEFDTMIARGKFTRLHEQASRDMRTEFTTEEFEENFDELFARVENGETLTVIHESSARVLFMPYDEYEKCQTGFTPKNDSN